MTKVLGGKEGYLLESAKAFGINKEIDQILMRPEVFLRSLKAPTKKRPYHVINLDLAFAPEIFTHPKSCLHLNRIQLNIVASMPKSVASDLVLNLEETSRVKTLEVLNQHPSLKAIWDRFLNEWTAEYDRVLETLNTEGGDLVDGT